MSRSDVFYQLILLLYEISQMEDILEIDFFFSLRHRNELFKKFAYVISYKT